MQFSIFASVAGFHHDLSTREGGVCDGGFSSLNLGFHVGDDAERVRENRRRFAQNTGFELKNLVAGQQVHGARVATVTGAHAGSGALDWESALPGCDALVTRETNLPLLILVADCAPILLVDPTQHVLAVVHAGWRGAMAGVASQTVQAMTREFGTRGEDVLAAVGPCLSIKNLEVGEEVAHEVETKNERAVVRRLGTKPHLDLRALITDDLTESDVKARNIEVSPFCPRERGDLFFSHRGQSGHAGRFGIVAWWG